MSAELRLRVASGLVMAAVFIGAVIAGGATFTLLVAALSIVIWHEWYEMNVSGSEDRILMVGTAALVLMGASLIFLQSWPLFLALIVILAVACGLFLSWRSAKDSVAGLIYAGGFLISLALLRSDFAFTPGLVAIAFLCAVVWLTDIGAYFAGRHFGGPKLAPQISPNKTISGAIGGVLAALIGGYIVAKVADLEGITTLLLLAAMMSVVSQCGDLFESWMKRCAGLKDSGSLIPGHGGIMDRVDGLVFAAIFLWLVSSIMGTWSDPALALFG